MSSCQQQQQQDLPLSLVQSRLQRLDLIHRVRNAASHPPAATRSLLFPDTKPLTVRTVPERPPELVPSVDHDLAVAIDGLVGSQQVSVRRTDLSNTPVTVKFHYAD